MTYGSIVSSAWVWLAASFLGAALGVVVWSLLRMASIQSREEEAAEAERAKLEALTKLRAEFEARRRERV